MNTRKRLMKDTQFDRSCLYTQSLLYAWDFFSKNVVFYYNNLLLYKQTKIGFIVEERVTFENDVKRFLQDFCQSG